MWTASVDCKCGLQVWIASVDCKCGLQVWTASVDCKCGLQVWVAGVGCRCGERMVYVVWDVIVGVGIYHVRAVYTNKTSRFLFSQSH